MSTLRHHATPIMHPLDAFCSRTYPLLFGHPPTLGVLGWLLPPSPLTSSRVPGHFSSCSDIYGPPGGDSSRFGRLASVRVGSLSFVSQAPPHRRRRGRPPPCGTRRRSVASSASRSARDDTASARNSGVAPTLPNQASTVGDHCR